MSSTNVWPPEETWAEPVIAYDTPRLRLDTPFLNEGTTVLRCEYQDTYYTGVTNPVYLDIYRRESTNRVDWGEWEMMGRYTIDGSKEYFDGEVFTIGNNLESGLREGRLLVSPPATLGNYYQYCARLSTNITTGFETPVSEWGLSENCLRYGHVEFGAYTDDPLVPGETYVRAVHMTELQERVALIYDHFAYGAFDYTPAVSGVTSLGLWLQQVNELRNAIDAHFPVHEDWLEVEVCCPRADVMEQLRRVVNTL